MAMMPRSAVLLLCAFRLSLATACDPQSEACDVEDSALLQYENNPRFNILQVSEATVRKAKRCSKEYFDKLLPFNISREYKQWKLRHGMPATSRNLVIAAGMGTTGTHGVVVALEDLGMHGYHFKDARASANKHAKDHQLPDFVVPIVDQLKQNASACYNAVKSFDFSQLPANVEYVSDTPFTEMFLDMYTQFPTAKVILTTRPSLEWAKSRKKHGKTPPPVLRPCGLAAVEDYSDKDLAGMLDAYNELVRCVVPPGNLLEINLFKHGDKLTDTLSSFLNNRLLVQSGHEKHAKSKAKAKTAKKPSA